MGSQFTKEQTELFTRYQPTLHQACAFPAKFAEITENVSAELSAQKK